MFNLWWKESLLNHQKFSKYYEYDWNRQFAPFNKNFKMRVFALPRLILSWYAIFQNWKLSKLEKKFIFICFSNVTKFWNWSAISKIQKPCKLLYLNNNVPSPKPPTNENIANNHIEITTEYILEKMNFKYQENTILHLFYFVNTA